VHVFGNFLDNGPQVILLHETYSRLLQENPHHFDFSVITVRWEARLIRVHDTEFMDHRFPVLVGFGLDEDGSVPSTESPHRSPT
jgi:hypothetical protein